MSSPLLQINNLQVDFVTEIGTTTAVKDISITVNRGEIVAIVGESGSGKSVTSLSILQLLPKASARYPQGDIRFSAGEGEPVNLLTQTPEQMRSIRGNQIAMIFQEPMTSLNPVFTCGHQVQEALRLHLKIGKKEAREKTIELFNRVKLPNPGQLFRRYPHQVSGGQKQRVMIAMAMSCEPSLLICDEPTTALDVTVQKTILQLIKELQQTQQMGVIFITHDLGVVAEVADRAVVMYRGEIVESGTVASIFTNPRHPYTKGLLACRPVLHPKGERLPVVSDFLENNRPFDISRYTQVVEPPVELKEPDTTVKQPFIQVSRLNVWFPSKTNLFGKPVDYVKAIDNIRFEIYKGETLGLVGESGCGKTTLGRTLLGLIQPTSGSVRYDGTDLAKVDAQTMKEMRKDIQIIFQDPYSSLNPRLTIGAAIAEPLKVHNIISSPAQRKDRVVELLEKVNLKAEHFNRYPHEFSGGQRQRIVIARALALKPDFIVCDESVSALDVSVQAQVLNLLNDLKAEMGFTIVFISHDLSVVRYISDRIMVMNKGKIEEIGDAEQVYFHPQKEYTKQLISSIPKGLIS
ncbi:ABC transporter ATP-binding protein [Niastella koreensis]|uniref:Nickel-transporting ATPase., Sulfate-transporting ATPase n=2 Tax=Niastella koreensis TaxID=354356 RepID=G8T9V4_NIAKG|nr:ABC transporter ATP-binding protein [Niastella koreensis]AEW01298.1 Nickel-transporting ATPase., Sulfate-transporting ATPase [Niastella koreensis GR20-10]OQP46368.1 ABC transporter ATP-binding protein [Niastella koreensis]